MKQPETSKANPKRSTALARPAGSMLAIRIARLNQWIAQAEHMYREAQITYSGEAKSVREATGLSLRTVAKRMQVSAAFLSDLERGNRHWTTEMAGLWAEVVNAPNDTSERRPPTAR